MYFFWGAGGLEPVQSSVPIPANGGSDPEVIGAVACTFLHEGRKPVTSCNLHGGQMCGTKGEFAAFAEEAAFGRFAGLHLQLHKSCTHLVVATLI